LGNLRRAFASSPERCPIARGKAGAPLSLHWGRAGRVDNGLSRHVRLEPRPAREGFHRRTLRRNFPSWVSVSPPVVSSTNPQLIRRCKTSDERRCRARPVSTSSKVLISASDSLSFEKVMALVLPWIRGDRRNRHAYCQNPSPRASTAGLCASRCSDPSKIASSWNNEL
jgi:hypothetical protein